MNIVFYLQYLILFFKTCLLQGHINGMIVGLLMSRFIDDKIYAKFHQVHLSQP